MSGWMKTSRIGGRASAIGCDYRPRFADPLVPVGEKAGEREDDQQLPELGRLEAEERRRRSTGASRARPSPSRKTMHEDDERADVDVLLVAAVDVRVDADRDDEPDEADRHEDELAVDEVVGVAGDVVVGDPGDLEDDDPRAGGLDRRHERARTRRSQGRDAKDLSAATARRSAGPALCAGEGRQAGFGGDRGVDDAQDAERATRDQRQRDTPRTPASRPPGAPRLHPERFRLVHCPPRWSASMRRPTAPFDCK